MCGCGKRTSPSRGVTVRPNLGPRPTVSLASGATPTQVRALGMQATTSLTTARQMDGQRRRVEKLRRDAIKNSLNK